jgi:hypothetical protein
LPNRFVCAKEKNRRVGAPISEFGNQRRRPARAIGFDWSPKSLGVYLFKDMAYNPTISGNVKDRADDFSPRPEKMQ